MFGFVWRHQINLIFEWGSISPGFGSCVEINLILWGIEFYLVLVLGSEVTCFRTGDCNWPCAGRDELALNVLIDWLGFVWVVVVEIDSDFGCGTPIAWFYCEHRNWLALVWAVDIDLISVWGIEHDFDSVQGSELICFVSGGRKWIGFSIWIEINLISCDDVRPQIDMEYW